MENLWAKQRKNSAQSVHFNSNNSEHQEYTQECLKISSHTATEKLTRVSATSPINLVPRGSCLFKIEARRVSASGFDWAPGFVSWYISPSYKPIPVTNANIRPCISPTEYKSMGVKHKEKKYLIFIHFLIHFLDSFLSYLWSINRK